MRNFKLVLLRSSLLSICNTFIHSHLDYVNVVYELSYKSSFNEKRESIQYEAVLTIIGAIQRSFSEKL